MKLTPADLLDLEEKVSVLLKKYGKDLLEVWQTMKQVSLKDYREPVTEFDISTEKAVRAELLNILPEAGFVVEEGEDAKKDEFNWIIDPIDQTKNFIGQLPLFYIQVALTEKDVPVLGVIYNPVSDQLFCASMSNGVKLNGKPMIVEAKSVLKEAIIEVDFGGNDSHVDWKIEAINTLFKSAYRVRITGASFYPYIATSAIHGYVGLCQKTKIPDMMPRIILARELGLVCETMQYAGQTIYVAASKSVFEEIKNLLSA